MWLKRLNNGQLASAVLFLIGLPLALQLTFPQNDDWVYYRMVQNFMAGNFALDPISAPTFYFQGILGAVFAVVFGLTRVPVLTLMISVVNFYLVYRILLLSTKLGSRWSLLLALIWFFNPLNIYSSLGFMTENYLLFCILASLYYFNRYIAYSKRSHFLLVNLFLLLALLTKQSALALAVAYPMYFLINKKWRLFGIQSVYAILLFAFYFLLFPKTAEMYEKPLQFHHLWDVDYLKQLVRAIIIYISAFCFPVLLFLCRGKDFFSKRKNFIPSVTFIGLSVALYFLVFKNFKPNRLGWQELYYLDNTLERTGFYPRGVMGTKFYFRGNYDLYKYWDLIAKVFSGFVMVSLAVSLKKLKSQAHLLTFFGVYIVLMLLAEKVYDRYLPPLLLAFILIMSSHFNPLALPKKIRLVFAGFFLSFLGFLTFYSYQFSMDFILVNKYIWNRSQQLVDQEKIPPKLIKGTNAWKLSDYNYDRNYLYDFTFDDVSVNNKYKEQYDLIEKHTVTFPGSLWIKPDIYLYRKKNFNFDTITVVDPRRNI